MSTETNAQQDQIRLRIAQFVYDISVDPAETGEASLAAATVFRQQPEAAQQFVLAKAFAEAGAA